MKSTGIAPIECDGPTVLDEEMFGFSASSISARAALCVMGTDPGLIAAETALLVLAPPPGGVGSSYEGTCEGVKLHVSGVLAGDKCVWPASKEGRIVTLVGAGDG